MSFQLFTIRVTIISSRTIRQTHFNYFIQLCKYMDLNWYCFLATNFWITIDFTLRLPYNWRVPLGYLIAVVFQLLFFLGVLEIFVTFYIIYLDVCQFAVTLADDIEETFRNFKQEISNSRGTVTSTKQIEHYKRLSEIVEFHSNVIQLSQTHWSKIDDSQLNS